MEGDLVAATVDLRTRLRSIAAEIAPDAQGLELQVEHLETYLRPVGNSLWIAPHVCTKYGEAVPRIEALVASLPPGPIGFSLMTIPVVRESDVTIPPENLATLRSLLSERAQERLERAAQRSADALQSVREVGPRDAVNWEYMCLRWLRALARDSDIRVWRVAVPRERTHDFNMQVGAATMSPDGSHPFSVSAVELPPRTGS